MLLAKLQFLVFLEVWRWKEEGPVSRGKYFSVSVHPQVKIRVKNTVSASNCKVLYFTSKRRSSKCNRHNRHNKYFLSQSLSSQPPPHTHIRHCIVDMYSLYCIRERCCTGCVCATSTRRSRSSAACAQCTCTRSALRRSS